MDRQAALTALDEQLRTVLGASPSGGRLERVGNVVRCVGSRPDNWNGIDWSDLDETNADEAIADQIRYFGELGRGFEWKYYGHDRPADLPERLLRAGLEPGPEEAVMVADIAGVPADTVPPRGVRVVPVTDADGVRRVVEVHETVFDDDHSALGRMLLRHLDGGSVVAVLAMAGNVPVSSARIDFHEGTEFASLWGGGTVEAWRGKGIYRALVSYRARLAAERGYRYLRVDALPTSAPILARLGFARITTTVPYTFTPR
jgi:GNAT superfamily N-acetyltransferase